MVTIVIIQGSKGQEETKVWVSSEHLLYFNFNIEIWFKNVYRWHFGGNRFILHRNVGVDLFISASPSLVS
jgi:hypothetical protein